MKPSGVGVERSKPMLTGIKMIHQHDANQGIVACTKHNSISIEVQNQWQPAKA